MAGGSAAGRGSGTGIERFSRRTSRPSERHALAMQVGLRTHPLRLLAVALLSGVAAGLAPAALGTAPSPLTADQGVALYVGVVGLGVLPALVVAGWTGPILAPRSHP